MHGIVSGDERLWLASVAAVLPDQQTRGAQASESALATAIADGRCYLFVALDAGTPVGLLSAYVFPDLVSGGHVAYLYDIEVMAAHRGQLIGPALIEALLTRCRSNGVKWVWAGTQMDNAPARRIFERTDAELEGDRYCEYEWDLE